MKVKAEIGVMSPQAKGHQNLLEEGVRPGAAHPTPREGPALLTSVSAFQPPEPGEDQLLLFRTLSLDMLPKSP